MTDNAQPNSGFTRRKILLAGVGTAAVLGASVPLAGRARAASVTVPTAASGSDAVPQQFNWAYCNQCAGMFYTGGNQKARGRCPANVGSGAHAITAPVYSSYDYGFYYYAVSNNEWQGNWLWCHNCSGMFHNGNTSGGNTSYGLCPDYNANGGLHDGSQSYNSYVVYYSDNEGAPGGGFQQDWIWCCQCSGLFYGGGSDSYNGGICPKGGGDINGNYYYHNGVTIRSFYYWAAWSGSIPNLG